MREHQFSPSKYEDGLGKTRKGKRFEKTVHANGCREDGLQ